MYNRCKKKYEKSCQISRQMRQLFKMALLLTLTTHTFYEYLTEHDFQLCKEQKRRLKISILRTKQCIGNFYFSVSVNYDNTVTSSIVFHLALVNSVTTLFPSLIK